LCLYNQIKGWAGWLYVVESVMHCVFWMSKMRVLVNVSVNCVLNWVWDYFWYVLCAHDLVYDSLLFGHELECGWV